MPCICIQVTHTHWIFATYASAVTIFFKPIGSRDIKEPSALCANKSSLIVLQNKYLADGQPTYFYVVSKKLTIFNSEKVPNAVCRCLKLGKDIWMSHRQHHINLICAQSRKNLTRVGISPKVLFCSTIGACACTTLGSLYATFWRWSSSITI